MAKRTISKIAIAPGKPVRVEDFRYVDQGLEWNMQEEYDLRDDHLQASRVINWEVFGEAGLGLAGWTPGDSLLLYVTGVELFATEGLCYIGGRSYVLTANTELFDGDTPATNTYNIYLKYTLASDEFAYEYTTSTRTDDHLIKYLLIGTALYTSAVGWSNPIDKRASNTALGAPATVSGSDAGPIFTVENTGAGLGLLVKSSDLQVGEDGTPQIVTIWGTSTTGLTLKESGTANLVTLSCDATGRMKVTGSINVTATGSTIASSATVGGVTLNVGAVSGITTLGMNNQLTNTLAIGTAPFVITSTTFVDNLNVDKWDNYDLNLTGAADNEIVIFDYSNNTLKTADRVIGNANGNVPLSNGTVCVNLNADLLDGNEATAFSITSHTHSVNALTAMTADKDFGDWQLRAKQFRADVPIGTAPFIVTSTTLVTNLNADRWDGYQFSDYFDQAVKQASSPTFVGLTLSGTVTGGTWQGNDIAAAYLGTHNHTSVDEGGDYAWADITGFGAGGSATTVSRSDHNHDSSYYTQSQLYPKTSQDEWPKRADAYCWAAGAGGLIGNYFGFAAAVLPSGDSDAWISFNIRVPFDAPLTGNLYLRIQYINYGWSSKNITMFISAAKVGDSGVNSYNILNDSDTTFMYDGNSYEIQEKSITIGQAGISPKDIIGVKITARTTEGIVVYVVGAYIDYVGSDHG